MSKKARIAVVLGVVIVAIICVAWTVPDQHLIFSDAQNTNNSIQMGIGDDNIYMGSGNNNLHFGTGSTDTGVDQIRMNGGNDAISMGPGADGIYMGGDDGDKLNFATGTEISNNVTNSVLTIASVGDVVIQLGN